VFDGEVVLLHVTGPEVRKNAQHGAGRILRGCEVDRRFRRETVPGALADGKSPGLTEHMAPNGG